MTIPASRTRVDMTERSSTGSLHDENKAGQNCQQNIYLLVESADSSVQNYFPGNVLILLNLLMKYRWALNLHCLLARSFTAIPWSLSTITGLCWWRSYSMSDWNYNWFLLKPASDTFFLPRLIFTLPHWISCTLLKMQTLFFLFLCVLSKLHEKSAPKLASIPSYILHFLHPKPVET